MLVTVAAELQQWQCLCLYNVVAVPSVQWQLYSGGSAYAPTLYSAVAECPSEDSLEVLDQTLLPLLLRYFCKI